MIRPRAAHQIEFSISHVEAWAPGVTSQLEWQEWAAGMRAIGSSGEPTLQQMQPLLRRHAGRLGRFACSVAYDALGDLREVPVVFSSRYGEVSRSVELLSALAAGDELSPSTFGLSVHNAIPGLFSMARKETANSISLAAGDDSAEFGLIEACSLLDDGAEQVLLVVADVPLPAIYEAFADTSAEAFGWAALISRPTESSMRLQWSEAPSIENRAANEMPRQAALDALAVLIGDRQEVTRTSGTRQWRWTRQNSASEFWGEAHE